MSDNEEKPDAAPAKPTSNFKRVAVLAVLAGVLIGGTAGALWGVPYLLNRKAAKGDAPVDSTANTAHEPPAGKGAAEPIIIPIDGITVNPSGALGRFLMVGIGLVVTDSASVPLVEAKSTLYRDVIITTISQQPIEILSSPMQRDSLRSVLLGRIRQAAPRPQIDGLLFSQYVIQ
jgi:flagellar basal body-associated protein FliL